MKSDDAIKLLTKQNSDHFFKDELNAAIGSGDTQKMGRMMKRIAADGRRNFLETVSRSNAKAFYAYLARSEGQERWGSGATMNAPLIIENKTLQTFR